MLLLTIARFELRFLLGNRLFRIATLVTFVLLAAAMSVEGFELFAEGGLLRTAAATTMRASLVVSVAFVFVTTAFVAGAVVRDDETGFGPIVRSTPITTRDYLLGRYLGALAAAALSLLAVPAALVLGALAPWADPATLGPIRLVDHLYGYLVVALPNVVVSSAIFFALATITRSMLATYLGAIALVSLLFVLDGAFGDRPQLVTAVAIADPFGARALADATRYWTVAERSVMLPALDGALLANRIVWLSVAATLLALATKTYRVAERGMSRRELRRLERSRASSIDDATVAMATTLPSPRFGSAATRTLLAMRTRFEARQVVLSPAFAILMAWGLFTTLVTLTTQRDPDGRPTYPTTLSMIPELEEGFWLVPLLVAIYYAGELVWRERDRRVHELIDAAPVPGWTHVVAKTAAMALVLVAMLLTTVVASVAVQLALGHHELELDRYLLWYVLPTAVDMLLVAALAVVVQALAPHKTVGWGVMVLVLLWQQFIGAGHVLLDFGATPPVPLSDMNGAGSFWQGAWIVRVYWGAVATLLLVVAHLLWRRGSETRLWPRLVLGRRQITGATRSTATVAFLVAVASGGWTFYNTNILNEHRSRSVTEADAVDLERRYGRYLELPQPTIAAITLEVDIDPAARRAVTTGAFRLRNLTAAPIAEIHLRALDRGLTIVRADIDGARLVVDDARHRYRIHRLDRPMRPGEERVLTFATVRHVRGFRSGGVETGLVENGTFLSESELAPVIGMRRAGLIHDPALRRRHGLPEAPPPPRYDDTAATARATSGRGWATVDITVSTSADQTPLAPGNRVSDVKRDGRRTARFVSGVPIRSRFAVLSARYAERRRRHRGVELAVYHHPAHSWNVDRMLDAMAASLDEYRARYGPYQFDHVRIVEVPGFHGGAEAFAGTIPYAETAGFISDYDEPETIDYVTYLTAHELAHQYWAHQLAPAEMEGAGLLTETLAQYSAQTVMRRLRGDDQMRRYLQFELDRYLEGRRDDDPPLVRAAGGDHLVYRKGALAMNLLRMRMGEVAIDRALRALLERFRFTGPPYARSLDLVAALRAEATTPGHDALITDLFERVIMYDLRVIEPTATRRADGRWDVAVPVEAHRREGAGVEAPLDEPIEIGLFTAEPGRDVFDRTHVVALERRPLRTGRQVMRFVTERRPLWAGVDPYGNYIDRDPGDNVTSVRHGP